ncbi:MAG: hypothetical protein AB7O73_05705 [Bacteroidia bacterium]
MKRSKAYNGYIGKSGHLLVMSELLYRGWNVAIPEVDTGDDIFAVENSSGDLKRVQVKTAIGKPFKNNKGFSAQFSLRKNHVLLFTGTEMYYFFVIRLNDNWQKFLIFDIDSLSNVLTKAYGSSILNGDGNLTLHLSNKKMNKTFLKKEDVTIYSDRWEIVGSKTYFPIIHH